MLHGYIGLQSHNSDKQSPKDCDLKAVICFLRIKVVNSEKIYRSISGVNDEKV